MASDIFTVISFLVFLVNTLLSCLCCTNGPINNKEAVTIFDHSFFIILE